MHLLVCFFVCSLYSAFKLIRGNNQPRYWTYLGISSALGFYAMPSFLYPFITINIFILAFNYSNIRKQIIANAAIAVAVFFLYLPIFVFNGFYTILEQNKHLQSISRLVVLESMPSFYLSTISEITGIWWVPVVLLLILSLILLLVKGKKDSIIFYLIMASAPFVLLLAQSIIPFSRTFIYYAFLIPFLILLPFHDYLNKIKRKYILIGSLLIQLVLLYNFYQEIYNYDSYSFEFAAGVKNITGNNKYLVDDPMFDQLLEYQLKIKGYEHHELKFMDHCLLNVDSVNNYDYVIVRKDFDRTIKKTPVLTICGCSIYK